MKAMKRGVALLLASLMTLSLAACGSGSGSGAEKKTDDSKNASTESTESGVKIGYFPGAGHMVLKSGRRSKMGVRESGGRIYLC